MSWMWDRCLCCGSQQHKSAFCPKKHPKSEYRESNSTSTSSQLAAELKQHNLNEVDYKPIAPIKINYNKVSASMEADKLEMQNKVLNYFSPRFIGTIGSEGSQNGLPISEAMEKFEFEL